MMEKKSKMQFMRYTAIFFAIIEAVTCFLLCMKIIMMNVLPTAYVAIGIVIILAHIVLLVVFNKKIILTILLSIFSTLIIAMSIYGYVAISRSENTLENVNSNNVSEIVNMSIYVMADSSIRDVSELKDKEIALVTEDDSSDEVKDYIDSVVGKENVIYTYKDNKIEVLDFLLEDECDAIILEDAFVDIVVDHEEYSDIKDRIIKIYSNSVEIEVEIQEDIKAEEEAEDDASTEEPFIVYISGIDMWGYVNARSRSDVNILTVVNPHTSHIQLINTPRDYYVYLPNQDGMDKLTHAGLYGVESSESALENLYGIDIDYFIKMNFSGFEKIIDSIGGIDVYSEYDFTVEPIKHYTVGYNHVTGLEALAFARERYSFAGGDVQRGNNQMEVIKATISKITSPAILVNYDDILAGVEDTIVTDMPSEDIYSFIKMQLANGNDWHIDQYTVTGTDDSRVTYSIPGMSAYVMIPDENEINNAKELINNVLTE